MQGGASTPAYAISSFNFTSTVSPSTFTSCATVARVAGIVKARPSRMSNLAPCRGQAICVAVERPFAQRPAVVRADVVDGVERAADVKQHHQPLVDLDQRLAGIGNVGHFGDGDEVGHCESDGDGTRKTVDASW